jgi:hypothetical protein
MIADREPYIQERDAGRLKEYEGTLMLSETIFDPEIKGKRADKDDSRQYPAQNEPDFAWHSWRVGAWHTKNNWETFGDLLGSGMNIFLPMLQAAVIMGAKKIGVVGVDMAWPKDGDSHCWGAGQSAGAYPPASLKNTLAIFRRSRKQLSDKGIEVHNLSPIRPSPFGRIFGYTSYQEFVSGKCAPGT